MGSFRDDSGRLSLDLLSTLRAVDETDQIASPEALGTWVSQLGRIGTGQTGTPTHGQVRYAQRLREAVRDLLGSAEVRDHSRARVNDAAAHPTPTPALHPDGTVEWVAEDPVLAALSLVARDAIDLVAGPLLPRVRACANPACGDLFLDSSRPGTRRWCSMDRCGSLAKKQQRVARLT